MIYDLLRDYNNMFKRDTMISYMYFSSLKTHYIR